MSLTAQQRPFLAMAYVLDSAKSAELESFNPENIKANWNSLPTIPRGGKLLSNDPKQYMFGVILYDFKNSRSDLSQAGRFSGQAMATTHDPPTTEDQQQCLKRKIKGDEDRAMWKMAKKRSEEEMAHPVKLRRFTEAEEQERQGQETAVLDAIKRLVADGIMEPPRTVTIAVDQIQEFQPMRNINLPPRHHTGTSSTDQKARSSTETAPATDTQMNTEDPEARFMRRMAQIITAEQLADMRFVSLALKAMTGVSEKEEKASEANSEDIRRQTREKRVAEFTGYTHDEIVIAKDGLEDVPRTDSGRNIEEAQLQVFDTSTG